MRGKNRFLLAPIIVLFYLIASFGIARAEDSLAIEVDLVPPVISLVGEALLALNVGDVYVEAGATASDDVDGDITANILISGAVDTAVAGEYIIHYTVSDSAGNSAVAVSRQVIVNSVALAPQETFIIRHNDTILWQGTVSLPSSGTVVINDASGLAHTVNAQSVLAVLYSIDQSSDAFAITNLQYYDSFGSFYLKCILPAGKVELCDNWQYAVGNITPVTSIDANILAGEQTVGIFFGSPHRLNFDSNNININTEFLVKTENYNYLNNTWDPLTGVSVGVTLPNPDDMWNPTVISTQPVDASGSVTLLITESNTYHLGIVEDFYLPSYEVIVASTTVVAVPTSSSGGSSSTQSVKKSFDITLALDYLQRVQAVDGSFGGGKLFTDWVAIAYGAANVTGSSRASLITYLKNNANLSSLLTDNERRAMALLALGENPYDFQGRNYIDAIIKEFDGQQFGDKGLVNDDIFALIPLLGAGYDQNDDIIDQTVFYILSQQNVDGSWNKSIDMTAASIQALSPISSHYEAIAPALVRAEQYITSRQNDDGGFSSVYSTSWTTQAMVAVDKSWTKNNNTPQDYLGLEQAADGAAIGTLDLLASRIWATSYAIPAVLGKDWYSIFKKVAKPIIVEQPMVLDYPIAEDKGTESAVLGLKEILVENNTNKFITPADVLAKEISFDSSDQDSVTELVVASDTEKIIDSPFEETSNSNNNFLPLIITVAILIGGGLLFRFWKK